jgi:toxin YoeB
MRSIVFECKTFEQFTNWAKEDKKVHAKIVELINDIQSTPFSGLGKPEPLKYKLQGYWSRRITDEHRLVYEVTDSTIVIISCKYHYT